MPHVEINMFVGRDEDTKQRLADAVFETVCQELGCSREHLSVSINDVESKDWNSKVASKVNTDTIYTGQLYKSLE